MILFARALGAVLLFGNFAFANPYPDPHRVPVDGPYRPSNLPVRPVEAARLRDFGVEVVRLSVAWSESGDAYSVVQAVRERSGTAAFESRSEKRDRLGSFRGQIKNAEGKIWEDSIGTGVNYRKLVREFTFRFPGPTTDVQFSFFAENATTGKEELVLTKNFAPGDFAELGPLPEVEVREIGAPAAQGQLIFALYADGYAAERKEAFFTAAKKAADRLQSTGFPGVESFAFRAIFSPSAEKLGKAKDLGLPIPERDSFLGLYFPYWNNFGRWYNVVYPTREARFRKSLATVPYDYALALLDDSAYWGVGNYRELTAVPANASQFTYLLTHELGHYFGLNEEYEGGGPTELEFAPGVQEPWSQNITFLSNPQELKWKAFVASDTPVPTPNSFWEGPSTLGAYKGGYADSLPLHHSHKPGKACTMSSGTKFCAVCTQAIKERVHFDGGL